MDNKVEQFILRIKGKLIKNETVLRTSFLFLFKDLTGKEITCQEEKTTKGRTDIIFGKSIIELKSPYKFKNKENVKKAIKQAIAYKTKDFNNVFLFDGYKIINAINGEETEVNNISLKIFIEKLNSDFIKNRTKYELEEIVSPYKNKNLIKDIYNLAETSYAVPELNNWKELFEIASSSGGNAYLFFKKNKEIINIFGEGKDFNIALFSLHTYFSIIVKNILVENLYESNILIKKTKPKNSYYLEKGSFWYENNIFNMFNNDIFSWYTKVNNKQNSKNLDYKIESFVKNKLSSFNLLECLENMNEDFFNIVYESVIPHGIRKSLGEYYTPPETVSEILDFGCVDFKKKIMDPACGSGTFLIKIVQEKINLATRNNKIDIKKILSEITGFDINPVALIAAKANILLKIIKYRKSGESIFIPIYSSDSTVINNKLFRNILKKEVFKKEDMSSNEIHCFASEYLIMEEDQQHMALEMQKTKNPHLYNSLEKIIRKIRQESPDLSVRFEIDQKIFTNLVGEFDYLVGNPPWVKWSNLPENFRKTLKKRGFDDLFSPYKNSGGNSLDLYAPIIKAASVNYLKNNGKIVMIMPMSLNFNSSLETVRNFNFLKNNQKITKIRDFNSRCKVFKGVSINFGFFVIDNSVNIIYEKVNFIKNKYKIEKKYAHRNPKTLTIIPFESEDSFKKIKPFLGFRDPKIKVRSGVQFTPNKLRQFYISSENNGILRLVSSKLRKEQKNKIKPIEIFAEKEAVARILRTKDLKDNPGSFHYSWWLYEEGDRKPISMEKFSEKYPVLFSSLKKISKLLLDKKNFSKFNSRISKAPWYGNIRVGKYTQAPYRICFSDNGEFCPKLITDTKIIPEGHVRFIPFYNKKEAERIFNILKTKEVKELMRIQYLNLNKSFLPNYMYIKI